MPEDGARGQNLVHLEMIKLLILGPKVTWRDPMASVPGVGLKVKIYYRFKNRCFDFLS